MVKTLFYYFSSRLISSFYLYYTIFFSGLKSSGNEVLTKYFFDTITVKPQTDQSAIKQRADLKKINLRYNDNGTIGVSLDETVSMDDVTDLLWIFGSDKKAEDILNLGDLEESSIVKTEFKRTSPFLAHPVFNAYHSETRLVRYMKILENKDVSLVHSMIPLVSLENNTI